MDLNGLARIAANFYYSHTLVVIVGAAVLLILVLVKPKPMLKALAILVGAAVAVYIVTLIADMTFSGVGLKEKMIDKQP